MKTLNTFLAAVLILVVLFVLFKPGNKTPEIITALGSGSRDLTRTLTGQYKGSGYQ